ncbi:MAG: hypothetical protein QXW65_01410 [Candidatus Pacearchaeota archaeon]
MKEGADEQIKFIVERLKEGKPLPEEFKWFLFEGKQKTELVYFGKERGIDIITDTMAVSLRRVKTFGQIKDDGWYNMIIFGNNLQVLKELLLWKEAGKLKNPDGSLMDEIFGKENFEVEIIINRFKKRYRALLEKKSKHKQKGEK